MRTRARDGGVLDRPGRAVARVRPRRGARHRGVALVNPFIGTQDYGNTFPGAAAAVRHGAAQPGQRRPGRLRLRQHAHRRVQPHAPVRRRLRRARRGPRHADDRRRRLDAARALRLALPARHRDGAPRLLRRRPHQVRHPGGADGHDPDRAGTATPSRPPARPTCCSTSAGRTCPCTRRRSTSRATGRSRARSRPAASAAPATATASSSPRASTARSRRPGTWRGGRLTPGGRHSAGARHPTAPG